MNIKEIQKVVEESNNFNEALFKLKLNISGKSYQNFKKLLEDNNIDYSNFDQKLTKSKENKNLEELLQNNINYSSQRLKKKLISAGLKKDICECCGCSNIWQGKTLTLQLDHINGDHFDNRLENLRILCPNCHSQTETFSKSNKNRKALHYYCQDCGIEIYRGAQYCKQCINNHRKEIKNWPDKDTLLQELISGKSFVQIAKQYGASDNALRKHCKKLKLPSNKQELKLYMGQLV